MRLDPIVRVKAFDAESPPTVTVTMKLKGPLMLGLPLNTFELSIKPGGGASIDQVAGPGGPSEAVKVIE